MISSNRNLAFDAAVLNPSAQRPIMISTEGASLTSSCRKTNLWREFGVRLPEHPFDAPYDETSHQPQSPCDDPRLLAKYRMEHEWARSYIKDHLSGVNDHALIHALENCDYPEALSLELVFNQKLSRTLVEYLFTQAYESTQFFAIELPENDDAFLKRVSTDAHIAPRIQKKAAILLQGRQAVRERMRHRKRLH